MPRPLHQTIAFFFILSNGGITTTGSTVSSTVEKMGDKCAEHSSHQAKSLQLHRLPSHVSLAQQRRRNVTRHHFRPPPAHDIQGSHLFPQRSQWACPISHQEGCSSPHSARNSRGACGYRDTQQGRGQGAWPVRATVLPALQRISTSRVPWPPSQSKELGPLRTCTQAKKGFTWLAK